MGEFMKLSKRLETLISMVPPSCLVLDVGCDHGYTAIELVRRGKARYAIASDVRKGPLQSARDHIRMADLSGCIKTICCSGIPGHFLKEIPGEKPAKDDVTCIIAGMGGLLMRDILKEAEEELDQIGTFLFSPQSDIRAFRKTLEEEKLRILDEAMLKEDGKYYVLILASHGFVKPMTEEERLFGPCLLAKRSPVLSDYLLKQRNVLSGIIKRIEGHGRPESRLREEEVRNELRLVEKVLRELDR